MFVIVGVCINPTLPTSAGQGRRQVYKNHAFIPPTTTSQPTILSSQLPLASSTPITGRRRKLVVQKTQNGTAETTNILHQQWNAISSDGSVVFKILKQPESQHRARYQTEGSRGAIKDRAAAGFPTLRLEGYSRQTRIQIFIANDTGRVLPHMFYQVCRVTGKNSNPCDEKKMDGTDVIEFSFEPQLGDMTIVCDCVGILKERFADVEARFPKMKTWKNVKKKSTKCRLAFRTVIENSRGEEETLQVVSDVINCTQLPGTPEILKMSAAGSTVEGGDELWIIGKNFLKDTKVIFSHSLAGKTEPLWCKFTDPDQDLFHQTHLITKIPPFFDSNIKEDVEVTVYIKCGDKLSDPAPFTYRPKTPQFIYSHAGQVLSADSSLPRGVAAPAVAIAQQFAQTGSVSVISPVEKVEPELANQPRPTILEPLHDHKNKKCRLDYAGRNARRTRSVPRPNLINEDTVFVSEGTGVKVIYTSFAQNPMSPWKGRSPAPDVVPSVIQNPPQSILPDPLQPLSTKRSISFNDESSNSCVSHTENTRDTMMDENSVKHIQTPGDFSSSLTTDFSNVFRFKQTAACEPPTLTSYSNSSAPLSYPNITAPTSFSTTLASTLYTNTPALTSFSNTPAPTSYPTTLAPTSYTNTPAPTSYPTTLAPTSYTNTPAPISYPNTSESTTTSYPNTPAPTNFSTSPPTAPIAALFHLKNEATDQGCVILTKDNTTEPAASPPSANEVVTEENKELPNVSVKATSDEKATISISLPTSILRDQKHFQNVIETINNTLLRSSFNETEEGESEVKSPTADVSPPVPTYCSSSAAPPQRASMISPGAWSQEPRAQQASPTHWPKSPPPGLAGSPPMPTSHPVSVLSCRKRNFSSEPVAEQQPEFYTPAAVAAPLYPEPEFKLTSETEFKLVSPSNITGCTSVINETPSQPVSQPAYEDSFKPMEVTPPPDPQPLTTQPFCVYQETLQEKKWSAEFNEVLQTVIEDHKEGKPMEWSTPPANPPAAAPAAPAEVQQVQSWEAAAPILAQPTQVQDTSKSQGMEWTIVKETPTPEPATQYISVDAPPVYPTEAPLTKPTIQFLEPSEQPAVYDQFGSQILNSSFPVAPVAVLDSVVVEQVPMATYSETMVQIQGDPMLSETSAVMGAQKEIGSTTVQADLVSNQEWGQEWTYGNT